MKDKVWVRIQIPGELHRRIKAAAVQKGIPMRDLLVKVLAYHFEYDGEDRKEDEQGDS